MQSGGWTVLKVLQWTAAYFEEKGVESPRPSAEILLADLLGVERIDLYVRFDQPMQAGELAQYRQRIRRRVSGEPVAYITGKKGFWTLDLSVAPDVLIPRPDTETLIESALGFLRDVRSPRILDLGVGSGAIALALAANLESAAVFATDISLAALSIARKNAWELGLSDRVHMIASDWFSGLKPGSALFDLVVSNPPYIPSCDIDSLQVEISAYEPRLALDGDSDGLRPYRIMVPDAYLYVRPGGMLMFEIGDDQGEAVSDLIRASGHFTPPEIGNDLSGKVRMVSAVRRE